MAEILSNYNPPISHDLRSMYESAIAKEKRWQGGMQFSDVEETLLDHVGALFKMHANVGLKYSSLHSEVDSPETLHLFYVHDGGELGGLDLAHSVPNYDDLRERIKRRERATVRYITEKYIGDIELRAYVRGLHKRYEKPDPDDRVAQYAHVLDKFQAIDFGAKNVFPARKLTRKHERLQQLNHVYMITKHYAQNLMRNLGPEAQTDLLQFMDETLLIFRTNGYREEEVDIYRRYAQEDLLSAI